MKLRQITESNIINPDESVIKEIFALNKETEVKNGLFSLGSVDNGALPVFRTTIQWNRENSIPSQAPAAYMPQNKYSDHQTWEHLPKGLYLFPAFSRVPEPMQTEILRHELIHYMDPKVEMEKHQTLTKDPWENEPEQDAMLGPHVLQIVRKFKAGDEQTQQDILDNMRKGNIVLLQTITGRHIPQKFHRRFLTLLYNALKGDRAI